MSSSRRQFLKTLGLAGFAGYGLSARILAPSGSLVLQAPNGLPAFEVIPGSASGITFERTSARSPQFYLPETLGDGGGFIDYDNDGWMDIFLTDVDEEMFSLYHNNRDETFDDFSVSNGIGMKVRTMSGWGVKFLDYDNDGNMDLFIVSGHPDNKVSQLHSEIKYEENPLLFRNLGTGYKTTFENVSDQGGPVFARQFAARGLAVGDFNNDGGADVLMILKDGAPLLLRNNVGKLNHWLGIQLKGKVANPDAVGQK